VTSKESERPAEDANAKREANSIEKLARFTKRIVAVPKVEIDAQQRKLDRKKRGKKR
jgi:hypothetical protein